MLVPAFRSQDHRVLLNFPSVSFLVDIFLLSKSLLLVALWTAWFFVFIYCVHLHFCKFLVAQNRKEEELVPAFRGQDRVSSNPASWEEEEERTGFLVAFRWREVSRSRDSGSRSGVALGSR